MKRRILISLAFVLPLVVVGGAIRLSAQNQPAEPECQGRVMLLHFDFAYDKNGNLVSYDETGRVPTERVGYAAEGEAVEKAADRHVKQHDEIRKDQGNRHEVRNDGRTAAVFTIEKLNNGRYGVSGGTICGEDSRPLPAVSRGSR